MTATSEKAVIGGPLLVGTSGAACNAGTHGMLRNVSGVLEVCDGAGAWKAVAASVISCAGLPANTGTTSGGTGWVMVGNPGEPGTFCITDGVGGSANPSATYNGAKAACHAVNERAHLCTPTEMYRACREEGAAISIGANEVVDDIVFNGTLSAVRMDYNTGSCTYSDTVGVAAAGQTYRCCYK